MTTQSPEETSSERPSNEFIMDEWITFEDGIVIKVPRYRSPKDTAQGDIDLVKPLLIDPRDYLKDFDVPKDGPPPIVIAAVDDSFHVEVTNIAQAQTFWHRSMTHGELHFSHIGRRIVETEAGTVAQEPGQFVYFPRGIAHHNIGESGAFCLVLYVRADMVVFPKPIKGRKPWSLKEVLALREAEVVEKRKARQSKD